MPLVTVRRKGITPAVRKVPVSTCVVIMPMTLDRVGKEGVSSGEEPTRVESVQDAFEKFAPALSFRGHAGDGDVEFQVQFHIRGIRDFEPECLQKQQEVKNTDGAATLLPNDLASIKSTIDLLYRLKRRFAFPAVRRAWNDAAQRESIIKALGLLAHELQTIADEQGSIPSPRDLKPKQSREQQSKLEKSAQSSAECALDVSGGLPLPEGADIVRSPMTPSEILAATPVRTVLEEIFADLHPGFVEADQDIGRMFSPYQASEFLRLLASMESLLSPRDSYEQTVAKLQARIDMTEGVRDELLAQLFQQLRPIERSYREVMLFFENARVADPRMRRPVELYILNADSKAIRDQSSVSLATIQEFIRRRNDNFNFRDDIFNLVIPSYLPQPVREAFELIANTWGLLFISDLDDERSFKSVERQFLPGGKYEFMKRPEDRSAANVTTMGYVCLRRAYSFEKHTHDDDGLYGPPSLIFAAAVARADDGLGLAQSPVGSRFGQLGGAEGCRFEVLVGEIEHLSMERQLVPVIRDADNHLCFFTSRTLADDPYGSVKFFAPYRTVRYIERCCRNYLLQVTGQVLTREFMEVSIERPLKRLLDDQVEQGTILSYHLEVDKASNKRMQGICDISLELAPVGPGEIYLLKLDIPEFAKDMEKK